MVMRGRQGLASAPVALAERWKPSEVAPTVAKKRGLEVGE
jgi:hypothetical protein